MHPYSLNIIAPNKKKHEDFWLTTKKSFCIAKENRQMNFKILIILIFVCTEFGIN